MAIMCLKPKGSCVKCEHFRYNAEENEYQCYKAYDEHRSQNTSSRESKETGENL